MKRFLSAISIVTVAAMCASSASAQGAARPLAGILQAPPEIAGIVSIDAHNVLLVESQSSYDPKAPRQYSLFVPRHVYSGGLARLFGGSVIPTEVLAIPESARRSNFGAPGGVSSGFGGSNNNGNNDFNSGNNTANNNSNNHGNFHSFNRGFPQYAPQIQFLKNNLKK